MIERSNKNYEDYYEIIKVIDRGGYGIVYKGREKESKELRAIKVINLNKIKENLSYELDEKDDIKEKLKSYIDNLLKNLK